MLHVCFRIDSVGSIKCLLLRCVNWKNEHEELTFLYSCRLRYLVKCRIWKKQFRLLNKLNVEN